MKIYIAGAITNDPLYKAKFEGAEAAFTKGGHIVLNPANNPRGLTNAEYMRIDFAMIDAADLVYFLSDSSQSEGARLERAYCHYTGKEILGEATK